MEPIDGKIEFVDGWKVFLQRNKKKIILIVIMVGIVLLACLVIKSNLVQHVWKAFSTDDKISNFLAGVSICVNIILSIMLYKVSRNTLTFTKYIESENMESIKRQRYLINDEVYFNLKFQILNCFIQKHREKVTNTTKFLVMDAHEFSTKLINVNKLLTEEHTVSYSKLVEVIRFYNTLIEIEQSNNKCPIFRDDVIKNKNYDKLMNDFISQSGFNILQKQYEDLLVGVFENR